MNPPAESDVDTSPAPLPSDEHPPALVPRLPPPAPRAPIGTSGPPRSPIAFVPDIAAVRPTPPKRSRRGPLLGLLVLVALAGGALYALVLRDPGDDGTTESTASSASDGTTAPAGDALAALPDLRFDRPPLTTATWTEWWSVIGEGGDAAAERTELRGTADYVRSLLRVDSTSADGSVTSVVITPDATYSPGETFGAPWSRRPRTTVDGAVPMDDPQHLGMYQDIVTDRVRSGATNVTTSGSAVDGISLTTYSFDVDGRALADEEETALPSFMDADALVGNMEVTIDGTGLVRRWSFAFDETVIRDAVVVAGESMPLGWGFEIAAVNTPVEVTVPTEFVDVTADAPDESDPGMIDAARSSACETDRRTLEVAAEAWLALSGGAAAPTEAQLVADEFLRIESATYDIIDGEVVAVAGGGCA